MPKKKKQQKTTYCSWEDLKNDPEQQAIYKEIANIGAYLQQKAYERSKAASH